MEHHLFSPSEGLVSRNVAHPNHSNLAVIRSPFLLSDEVVPPIAQANGPASKRQVPGDQWCSRLAALTEPRFSYSSFQLFEKHFAQFHDFRHDHVLTVGLKH